MTPSAPLGQGARAGAAADAPGAGHEHQPHRRRQRRARVGASRRRRRRRTRGSRRRRRCGRCVPARRPSDRRLRQHLVVAEAAELHGARSGTRRCRCRSRDRRSGRPRACASAPAVSVTARLRADRLADAAADAHGRVAGRHLGGREHEAVLSMRMARAAAALAWAIESGMFLGPCAVPHRNMPVRCVSTGASLGWYSLMKPAAGGLQAGHLGDVRRCRRDGLEAGREHDEVEELLVLAPGHRVLEAHAQALVGLLDDLARRGRARSARRGSARAGSTPRGPCPARACRCSRW